MGLRDRPAEPPVHLIQASLAEQQVEDVDLVADQGRTAAVDHPGRAQGTVRDETDQEFFVVALQVHGLEPLQRLVDQHVDHLEGLRSAIDVVAEVHEYLALSRRAFRPVVTNRPVHFGEQIGAAVNVADGIDPRAVGNAGRRRVVLLSPGHVWEYDASRPFAPLTSERAAPEGTGRRSAGGRAGVAGTPG